MILLAIIVQVQVDWRAWLYGMRPGKTLVPRTEESFIMTHEGFLLGVGHSRPYPDIHAVAWALTPDGYTLWQFHQDTLSYDFSALLGCCANRSGQLYAAGRAVLPGYDITLYSSFIIRLDPLSGYPVWSYRFPVEATNTCSKPIIDPHGNLWVLGSILDSISENILVLSLDTAGNLRCYFEYDGPYHEMDQARDIGADPNGNIYLAGVREDSTISCTEIKPLVIKLDSAGNLLWISVLTALKGYAAVKLNLSGKWLYVVGWTEWSIGAYGVFLARLDTASGSIDWLKEYTSSSSQELSSMIMDKNNNIYLGGGGGQGCWEIMCLDTLGNEKWRFYAEPDANNSCGMLCLVMDTTGNLFAGGWDGEFNAAYKLDTLGNLIWGWRDTITDYDASTVSGLVPDGQGGVYVQEWFTTSIPDPPYYTNITSVVHLTEGQAIAENPGQGQGIRIAMAPSGFLISGYEGEAQVYDPAGRLILTREIKSKALIGPLKPGVYFVVAGRQRAKVAVR